MEQQTMTKNYSKEEKKLEFKQKLEYLKKAVDYGYLLQTLGFEIERDSYKEARGPCIIHGGDNKTAFRFNKELGTWVCFTSKCHEIFGNDVIGLIKAVRRVDFMDAVKGVEKEIILDNRVIIDLVVEKLLDSETIEGNDFRQIVKQYTTLPNKK